MSSDSQSNFKEVIARALAPVEAFLSDPTVSEVMINGPDQIFIERRGKLELTTAKFPDEDTLQAAINTIAQSDRTADDSEAEIGQLHSCQLRRPAITVFGFVAGD